MRSLKGWKLNGSCLKWLLLFVGSSSADQGTPFSPTTIKPITSLNKFKSSPTTITGAMRTTLMWGRRVMRSSSLKVRWWWWWSVDNRLSLHQSFNVESFLPDFILGVCWARELYKVIPDSLISSDVRQDSFPTSDWSAQWLLSSDWLIVTTQTPDTPLGRIWYLPSHHHIDSSPISRVYHHRCLLSKIPSKPQQTCTRHLSLSVLCYVAVFTMSRVSRVTSNTCGCHWPRVMPGAGQAAVRVTECNVGTW